MFPNTRLHLENFLFVNLHSLLEKGSNGDLIPKTVREQIKS